MGLQYVDGSGFERTLTVADMLLPEFQESYSDLYKELHGFRPRGHDVETMLRFYDSYEVAYTDHQAEEARQLKFVSERDGVDYTSWTHYYDILEEKQHREWEQAHAARQAELERKAQLARRYSTEAAIEDWEHGAYA